MATVEAGHLTREIAQEGDAKNTGKAELLPRLHGTGSHLVHRELNNLEENSSQPKVVTEARHLGPFCHFKFLAHKECQRRICAARRSAPVAFGIWRTDTSYVTERSAILAHVVGPLTSAAEAVLCTSAEWKKFDSATKETQNPDGTITYSSWSNEKVWKYWRLPTAHTEARVTRLKWAQELSQRPQTHCQVLAALFGDPLFGDTRASPEGRIIRPIGPWHETRRGHRIHGRDRRRCRGLPARTRPQVAPPLL